MFLSLLLPAHPPFLSLSLNFTIVGAQPLPRGLQHGAGRRLVRPIVFIEEAKSDNPKRGKSIAKTCFFISTHSFVSLSRRAPIQKPLPPPHRAYVLFLTFAEVAKGGWTREVYKVNWSPFFPS